MQENINKDIKEEPHNPISRNKNFKVKRKKVRTKI